MPRSARYKHPNAIYHIMARSISELKLFKDKNDYKKYLSLVKKYKQIYGFKLYGYCLMGNHIHFILDANGADISKIMQGIDFSYAIYYNKKYRRHGHLFQGRFKSKIIKNERYLRTVSLYVHNNPRDYREYEEAPQKYAYSSLGVYIGNQKDLFDIVDDGYILEFFGMTLESAREYYKDLILRRVKDNSNEEVDWFYNEKAKYKSWRVPIIRNCEPDKIRDLVCEELGVNKYQIHIKNYRAAKIARAIIVLALKRFCLFSEKEICSFIGGITQSRVNQLCNLAVELINKNSRLNNLVEKKILKC